MSELEIQKALRGGSTFETLLADYSIKHRRHSRYPNLVLFKYDQIASPFGERIVQECRGIVLDEADNWRVVSRAFDKFFNHGEGNAVDVDWSTAEVQEKLDGSLCTLYHYDSQWHVATTGTPDAGGQVHGCVGVRFTDLFWKTYTEKCGAPPPDSAKGHSFYFELTSPFNRIVVDHQETGITLLGARHLESGVEMGAHSAREVLGRMVPVVRSHPLRSIEDILDTFETINPLKSEGYVVCDATFQRIKVKHPGYVALHHAVGSMNHRGLLEVARSGEVSEVAASFPEIRARLEEMRGRIDALVAEFDGHYERLCGIKEQKAFAIEATKTRHSSVLFMVRSGKAASVRSYLKSIHIDRLSDLLGYGTVAETDQEAA